MRRWALPLMLSACTAPKPVVVTLAEGKLPPARVTTKSELVLLCTPGDGDVELDGVPQGTCEDFRGEPKGLPLKKGAHRVQVKKRGYLPWDTIVETDGTRVMLNVTLISTSPQGTP